MTEAHFSNTHRADAHLDGGHPSSHETLTLEVERMTYGPDAIAHRDDGKTVFVGGAVAGDVVEAEVVEDGPRFCRANVTRIVQPSPDRVAPAWDLAPAIDGCPWAGMSRPAQLAAKRANVVDALERIGHFSPDEAEELVEDCEAPSDAWGYRNKVELGFARKGNRAVVGMHVADSLTPQMALRMTQGTGLDQGLVYENRRTAPNGNGGTASQVNGASHGNGGASAEGNGGASHGNGAFLNPGAPRRGTSPTGATTAGSSSRKRRRKGRKSGAALPFEVVNGIVKVDSCPLLDEPFQGLVRSVGGAVGFLANSHDLEFERIGIRASSLTGQVEVALWTAPGPFPRAQAAKLIDDATQGAATSVVRVMTKGPSKARKIAGLEVLGGLGHWEERLGRERMLVSAPSFFQVNTAGANRLRKLVFEALEPRSDDEAMDLYSGVGTFTLPLARRVGWVSAVESYGPAVRDLRRNLDEAGIANADPIGGDANLEFPDTDADIIVVDPPRAGLAPEVVSKLSQQPARAIAYVSCDPATLARDLARFVEEGTFRPVRITPVDLFPQTFHVETVTQLVRV